MKQHLFRGSKHVVCSYTCYACIGTIEIYEEKRVEGYLCIGLKFLRRDGKSLVDVGYTDLTVFEKLDIKIDDELS